MQFYNTVCGFILCSPPQSTILQGRCGTKKLQVSCGTAVVYCRCDFHCCSADKTISDRFKQVSSHKRVRNRVTPQTYK